MMAGLAVDVGDGDVPVNVQKGSASRGPGPVVGVRTLVAEDGAAFRPRRHRVVGEIKGWRSRGGSLERRWR
jgi:hypothetical protein